MVTGELGGRVIDENIDENEDITPDVVILQDELQILRRRLQDAPKRVRTLEERLA